MNDLRLSIRQTYAAIGITTEAARQELRSPRGELSIKQPPAQMEFQYTDPQLSIDSSDAWHALGKGPNLEWSSNIYSQMKSVFLQNLAKTVAEGERMADFTNPRSAFADLARDALFRPNLVNYQVVSPGYDNVKLNYIPGKVETNIEPSPVQVEYTPQKVEFEARRGQMNIYLRQQKSISIEVTKYDMYK